MLLVTLVRLRHQRGKGLALVGSLGIRHHNLDFLAGQTATDIADSILGFTFGNRGSDNIVHFYILGWLEWVIIETFGRLSRGIWWKRQDSNLRTPLRAGSLAKSYHKPLGHASKFGGKDGIRTHDTAFTVQCLGPLGDRPHCVVPLLHKP
jgi:hypothetical protein